MTSAEECCAQHFYLHRYPGIHLTWNLWWNMFKNRKNLVSIVASGIKNSKKIEKIIFLRIWLLISNLFQQCQRVLQRDHYNEQFCYIIFIKKYSKKKQQLNKKNFFSHQETRSLYITFTFFPWILWIPKKHFNNEPS